jgi:hypothetical protein
MQQISLNPQDLQSLLFAALIEIFITALFCRSLTQTLSHIQTDNRKINSVIIWLLLIPGVKYLVNFGVVFGMASSISKELTSRDFEEVKQPGLVLGLVYSVLSLLPIVVYFINIPEKFAILVGLLGLAQMIFFIQYWMKINWYKVIFKKDEHEDLSEEQQ